MSAFTKTSVQAPCPFFGDCGGCRLQDQTYSNQVETKKQHLARLLRVEDIQVFTAEEYNYRNRVDMVFHPGGIGFRRRGSWDKIVDVTHCLIAEPRINVLIAELRAAFPAPDSFDVRHHTGTLRYAVIRVTRNSSTISFILNPDSPGCQTVEHQIESFAMQCSADNVLIGYVSATTDVSTTEDYNALRGSATLTETFLDNSLEYHSQGFFQVNHNVSELMVSYVRDLLARDNDLVSANSHTATHTGSDTGKIRGSEPRLLHAELLDLYGGVGSFGVSLAPLFGRVTVMENYAGSIESARQNLNAAGFLEARAVVDDAAEADRLEYVRPLFVVSDPPRSGMHPAAIRRLTELAPRKIVYVSCNPEALAEELPQFRDYQLGSVALFDMFPQTPHFEAVVELIPRTPVAPGKVPFIEMPQDNPGQDPGARQHPQTHVMRLTTNPGLENVVVEETHSLFPTARLTPRPGGIQAQVLFEYETDKPVQSEQASGKWVVKRLQGLGAVHRVISHLCHFTVGRDSETPAHIAERLSELEVPGLAAADSFRVTTERTGNQEFRSELVQRAVGAMLVRRYDKPVKLDEPALELRVDVLERHCLVGVDHGPAAPPHRQARVFQPRITLNPVVAYAMLHVTGLLRNREADITLLDPFVGSGTILVEAGAQLPNTALHGIEIDPTTAAGARTNIEAAGLTHRTTIQRADARLLSQRVAADSIDCIVTNPPFGVRMGKNTDFGAFYRDLLREFSVVLRPDAMVALLVGKRRYLFLESLQARSDFELCGSTLIETAGVFPELFVLRYHPSIP